VTFCWGTPLKSSAVYAQGGGVVLERDRAGEVSPLPRVGADGSLTALGVAETIRI